MPPSIVSFAARDYWFDADLCRVYATVTGITADTTDPASVWRENGRHLLYPILAAPPVRLLMLAGVEPLAAVRVYFGMLGGVWVAAVFALLRLAGCMRLDSVLFSALAALSASALYWLTVPESFSLGSITVMLPLMVVGMSQRGKIGDGWFILASAASLGVTVTNWLAGIGAAFAALPWRRSLKVTVSALLLVAGLFFVVQRPFFPGVPFVRQGNNTSALLTKASGGPVIVARSFFFHSVVMPHPQFGAQLRWSPVWTFTQRSGIGSGSVWGVIAAAAWGGLLAFGLYATFASNPDPIFRRALLFALGAQLLVHWLFGSETFLFSLHWTPLLIVVAALGTRTRYRQLVLALAGALVLAGGFNNLREHERSVEAAQACPWLSESTSQTTVPSSAPIQPVRRP